MGSQNSKFSIFTICWFKLFKVHHSLSLNISYEHFDVSRLGCLTRIRRHIVCILEVSTIHQVSMATLMSYLYYMHYAHNLLIQGLQWHYILSSFFFHMSIFMVQGCANVFIPKVLMHLVFWISFILTDLSMLNWQCWTWNFLIEISKLQVRPNFTFTIGVLWAWHVNTPCLMTF